MYVFFFLCASVYENYNNNDIDVVDESVYGNYDNVDGNDHELGSS